MKQLLITLLIFGTINFAFAGNGMEVVSIDTTARITITIDEPDFYGQEVVMISTSFLPMDGQILPDGYNRFGNNVYNVTIPNGPFAFIDTINFKRNYWGGEGEELDTGRYNVMVWFQVIENPDSFYLIDETVFRYTGYVPDTTTGMLEKPVEQVNISVYPNPVSDQLNIVLPGNADAIISITSLAGQVIYFSRLSTIKTSIDVSSLKPGMYIVSFQNGGQQGTKTFIKQ